MNAMNGTAPQQQHEILLLAERMRVEERLMMTAFSAAGHSASILTPASVALGIGTDSYAGRTVIVRLPAGRESTTLSLLLDDAGATVVNSPDLTARLEDRARLLHWLSASGFTTLPATIGFSEESILDAASRIGFPVVLSPLDAGQQSVIVHDLETAEAVVEHRAVLGGERALIVRQSVSGVELRRIIVAGEETFVARAIGDWPIRDETAWQPVDATAGDIAIADHLRDALGVGVYHADCIAGDPATILKVRPLSDFRTFHDDGYDVAGAIVRHVLTSGAGVTGVAAVS
jgi:[lysine-biosynthesis-protein LysW]--L-2-aminoadipate ligase